MLAKRVEGVFKGYTFLVVNRWFGGLKFYHNDQLIAQNKDLFATNKTKPIIAKRIIIENIERLIEVYVYAITKVKIQIRVDDQKITDDDF